MSHALHTTSLFFPLTLILAFAAGEATPRAAEAHVPIGVEECDSYIQQFTQCVSRLPSTSREELLESLDRTRASWRVLSRSSDHREQLATSCKSLRSSMREMLRPYGCGNL